MIDIFKEQIGNANQLATSIIGEHTLAISSENHYEFIDEALIARQNNNRLIIVDLSSRVIDNKKALKELLENKPEWEYSWFEISKYQIKNSIFGMIAGFILSSIWLTLSFFGSNRILSADKLVFKMGLTKLGCIPKENNGAVKRLDRWAVKLASMKLLDSDRNRLLSVIAYNICAVAQTKGVHQGMIAITGTIPIEKLDEIAQIFNTSLADNAIQFAPAGNPMIDATAYRND